MTTAESFSIRKLSLIYGLAMVGGLLIGAGRASAQPYTVDELEYIHDARAIGVDVSTPDAAIVKFGWEICRRLTSGEGKADVGNALYKAYPTVEPWTLNTLVDYAWIDLCPNAGKSS